MLVTQDLRDFSISTWYPAFEDIAIETIIIQIPEHLIQKFRSDASDLDIKEACSAEYLNQLKNTIKSFSESTAFVKNNWHAPHDAKFISFGNSLKVSCVDDIFLYLSASQLIMQDFESDKYNDFCIVLRPWINIHPASEFRCIVVNNILQGITPRDWPTFYPHFKEDGPKIISTLTQFFHDKIRHKFNRKNYTFDVILTYADDIVLLDFGALNNKTNYYAFTWKEIQKIVAKDSAEEVAPVLRYLDKDIGIMTKSEALQKIAKQM